MLVGDKPMSDGLLVHLRLVTPPFQPFLGIAIGAEPFIRVNFRSYAVVH